MIILSTITYYQLLWMNVVKCKHYDGILFYRYQRQIRTQNFCEIASYPVYCPEVCGIVLMHCSSITETVKECICSHRHCIQ